MTEISKEMKAKLENLRKIRAFSIIAKGTIPKRIEGKKNAFIIPSQNNSDKTYTVWKDNGSYVCDCPDHMETGLRCKHIQSIELWHKLQDGTEDIIKLMNDEKTPQCPECDSINVVRNGTRKTHMGKRQRYLCKQCGYRFTIEIISNRKANTKLIALTMDLFFKGLSLRKISDTIEQFYGVKISHVAIRDWINTFMNKINKYVAKYNPDLGEVWNIDEQKVKAEKEWWYSWNILDEKTRFLIANTITKERSSEETGEVFHKAIGNVEGKPRMAVTDGLPSYKGVVSDVFPEAVHIHNAGIRDPINNNKLERFHGTWRERDKVMRGMQNKDTAEQMLENYRTYYNFIRKHQGLENKTPAEVANIDLDLENNRWVGLIKKSMEVVQ